MNNYHINLIRANTGESDISKIEQQLSEIYERTSVVLFDSMIKNWIKMSDEQKIEIALLNCGSKENLIPFLGLLEGLAGNINDIEE